jgi:membrane protein implicated in regulation of membrane protease activity
VHLENAGRWALLGVSLASAAVGAALAVLLGGSWWIGALVGLPLAVLALVVVDRRRSRRALTSWSWTDDLAEVEAAALVLGQEGIEVEVENDPESHPRLVFRASETRRVADVLHLPMPPQL